MFTAAVLAAAAVGTTEAQPPPVFRSGVTLVTTDVIVRDGDGQFIPDLTRGDFTIYEDGVPQQLASLVLVHGGRVFNQLLPPPPVQEGNHPAGADPIGRNSRRRGGSSSSSSTTCTSGRRTRR